MAVYHCYRGLVVAETVIQITADDAEAGIAAVAGREEEVGGGGGQARLELVGGAAAAGGGFGAVGAASIRVETNDQEWFPVKRSGPSAAATAHFSCGRG